MTASKSDSTLVKVTIYKPHTHAGIRYTPDAKGVDLEVSKQDAEFLEAQGVTKKPATATAANTPA